MNQFASYLLEWFDRHGRHDLPWQIDKHPYRVWISEIMLQQTQVATVIPYYLRFMERFKTVEALAESTLDEVLSLWAGLGYYSRARNIWRSAQHIVREWNGHFPQEFEAWLALPGVGPSTAAAICSISFNAPYAILDGNVKRVLARVFAFNAAINTPKAESTLRQLATDVLPKQRYGDYTQAIMDLGALLCTTKLPQCSKCPCQSMCKAYALDEVARYPIKRKPPQKLKQTGTMVLLKVGTQVAIRQQPLNGLWPGLWSFPILWREPTLVVPFVKRHLKPTASHSAALNVVHHVLTHKALKIFPVVFELQEVADLQGSARWQWYDLTSTHTIGFTRPMQKVLKELINVL